MFLYQGHSVKVQKARSLIEVCSLWGGLPVVWRESTLVTLSTMSRVDWAYGGSSSKPTVCFRPVSEPVQQCGHRSPFWGGCVLWGRPQRRLLVMWDRRLRSQPIALTSHPPSPGAHVASAVSSSINFLHPHPHGHDWALRNYLSPGLAFNHH